VKPKKLEQLTRRASCVALISIVASCSRAPRTADNVAPVAAPETPAGTFRLASTESVAQAGAPATHATRDTNAVSVTDLDKRTADLFGETQHTESLRLPLDSELVQGNDAEPRWDIDVRSYEMVDRVQHYVSLFTRGEARERFIDRMSHGTRYEPMIRAKLRAGDLPEDMFYLALVESGFNPNAYSRAAAVGMWQFMASTAQGMGLRVDWWVDERRDPVRSTEAAVRFLRGLREQFGSMYLAAAAYNGGPGRIARGLSRYADQLDDMSGDDQFFALAEKKYLRNETRDYVPQLVAAALIAKDSARFGISIPLREPYAYDSVRVAARVPLAAIAEASGVPVAAIQELNPQILRGMTPPRDSLKVRIPVGTRSRFDSVFATLPAERVVGVQLIEVSKGATWASLAKKYKVSAKLIPLYNPKVKPSKRAGTISAGTPVLIPSAEVAAAALSVPDPAIERYGGGTRTYVVRKGDNLSVIAKRYGTTPAAIMRLNRLKKPMIFPGQELLVRGSGKTKKVSRGR
jgi:membrane-bound lytic murein transglycosylase D